jgi:hypothetical protein
MPLAQRLFCTFGSARIRLCAMVETKENEPAKGKLDEFNLSPLQRRNFPN